MKVTLEALKALPGGNYAFFSDNKLIEVLGIDNSSNYPVGAALGSDEIYKFEDCLTFKEDGTTEEDLSVFPWSEVRPPNND